ncbi:MFS transporter [Streptomyces sp. NRRL S-920]|uniref:MFS transporter n=1 Tax=Streptomyces sp. NRRL S-920 TaxID=1463921 RepID=UPI0004C9CDA3|nr:MFS transporter [Streptomyces sp. NRRL S-920]
MSADTKASSSSSRSASTGNRPGSGRTVMLVVVLVAELMNALDGSVVYTALPSIQHDTGASGAAVQWIHAAYALTFALGLITGGRLGDLHGRKRLFLLGTGVFTAASLLCGLAGSPALLIAARVIQGGAAAVMVPQVLATLHISFDEGSRARAFSLYGTIMSLGSVAGPVLGGVLTSADLFGLGWRPIFLINVPIGLATVLLGLRYLRESRDLTARRLDLTGMILASLGLLLIAYPLTVGGAHHWPVWSFLMMAWGLLTLAVFLVQQRTRTARGRDPLVVLELFKRRAFTAGLSAQLVFGLLSGVFFLAWTLFMQDGLGLSPRQAATGFVAASVGEMAGAWLAMSLAVRHGRRAPQAGALLAAATLVIYAWLITDQSTGLSPALTVVPMLPVGLGLGMIGAALADITLRQVDHDHAGSASGLFNSSTQLGIALGTALTAVAFFAHAPAGSHGATVTAAFTGTLWYVIGALLAMWALMLWLPKRHATH